MNILAVAIGGGLGAASRYILGVWIKQHTKERAIPTAMLIVNLLGALGLGLFFRLVYGEVPVGMYEEQAYLFLGIGFFGAFTTFSTFSVEAVTLLKKHKWVPLFAYVLLTIGGSIFLFSIALLF